MNKPLPVKIVEALGWLYAALSVMWIVALIAAQVFGIDQDDDVWPLVLCAAFPLLLSPGMVLSLRSGRRGWFLVPHMFVLSYFSAVRDWVTASVAVAWGCCCRGTDCTSADCPHSPAWEFLCIQMV